MFGAACFFHFFFISVRGLQGETVQQSCVSLGLTCRRWSRLSNDVTFAPHRLHFTFATWHGDGWIFEVADYKRGMRMLSGAFPAKLKAIRIIHLNRALAVALSISMSLLSAKMRSRYVAVLRIASLARYTLVLSFRCPPLHLRTLLRVRGDPRPMLNDYRGIRCREFRPDLSGFISLCYRRTVIEE